MLRVRRYCLILALCLAPFSQGAAVSPVPASTVPRDTIEPFLAFFDTLALTEDYGPFNSRPPWIRKWNGPVTVVLEGNAESLRPKVRSILRRVSGWTGLQFSLSKQGAQRPTPVKNKNIITIRMISPDEAANAFTADDIVCQTETHGLGGSLHTGIMKIRTDFVDCLPHEFMHALGFDAHWDPKRETPIRSVLAFRDSDWRTLEFSPWDILAVTLLYDRRLRAGMPRGTGLKVARTLVDRRPQSAQLPPAAQPVQARNPVPGTQVRTDRPRARN
jgi:hypothetical protein